MNLKAPPKRITRIPGETGVAFTASMVRITSEAPFPALRDEIPMAHFLTSLLFMLAENGPRN
jgi:hypothetical protein